MNDQIGIEKKHILEVTTLTEMGDLETICKLLCIIFFKLHESWLVYFYETIEALQKKINKSGNLYYTLKIFFVMS